MRTLRLHLAGGGGFRHMPLTTCAEFKETCNSTDLQRQQRVAQCTLMMCDEVQRFGYSPITPGK
jgi:hypothetical protein